MVGLFLGFLFRLLLGLDGQQAVAQRDVDVLFLDARQLRGHLKRLIGLADVDAGRKRALACKWPAHGGNAARKLAEQAVDLML
jgi:hypothetical protein